MSRCQCEAYDAADDGDEVFETCECGHVLDEHEDTFLARCTVEVDS